MNLLRQCIALRRVVLVAMLSLVLGPMAALVHAIEHAGTASATAEQSDTARAWGHQAGSSDCHLVDHLLTGHAPAWEAPTWPDATAATSPVVVVGAPLLRGRASRPYHARGPPQS